MSKRTTFFNEDLIENPTKEFAYFLGFFWADGSIRDKGNDIVIEITTEDALVLKPIIDTLGTISFYSRNVDNRKDCKRKGNSFFYMSNKKLKQFMVEFDYRKKSIVSPEKIMNYLSEELQQFFIRGYFDGDGCIYVNKKNRCNQLSFSSTYDQDWQFLTSYFLTLNIPFRYTKKKNVEKNSKASGIRICDKKHIYSFFEIFYNSYSKDEIGLARKYEKFIHLFN